MTPEQRILNDILIETIRIQGNTEMILNTSLRIIDMRLQELVDVSYSISEADELVYRLDELIGLVNLYSLVGIGLLGIIIGSIVGASIMRVICR